MKALNITNENEMILSWLKSELYRMKHVLDEKEIRLVKKANLDNFHENQARKHLLLNKYGRSAILDKMPIFSTWQNAKIEERDKEKLYILPVFDWFLDTGRTFKVVDTTKHLSANRGHRLNNQPPTKKNHLKKITDMIHNPPKESGGITVVTTNINSGLFTIIEGVHRACALAKQNKLVGTNVFVGTSPDLFKCYWSIEKADIKQHLLSLENLVNNKMIW